MTARAHVPTQADLLRQLDKVVEPCSVSMGRPMSICEMGLIEAVRFDAGTVHVELCLTDASCINYSKICAYVTDMLLELDGVTAVNVTHTKTVLWTPDRITLSPRSYPLQNCQPTPG